MTLYKWAVFVRHKDGWGMEASVESVTFSGAAKSASAAFKTQKRLHPDKRVMVVKIFGAYDPDIGEE